MVVMCFVAMMFNDAALVGLQVRIRYGWFYVQIVCFVAKMFNDATLVGLQVQVRREVGK
jgi:hypothetical protein